MIARRLTGILLSLLTLNVTVLGADGSCAKHTTSGKHANGAGVIAAQGFDGDAGVRAANAPSATTPATTELADETANTPISEAATLDDGMSYRTMTGMMSTNPTDAMTVEMSNKSDQHAPCEIPSESNCCRALASCSVAFQTSESFVSSNSIAVREMIAGGVSTTPLSEIVAPDPPPPKA